MVTVTAMLNGVSALIVICIEIFSWLTFLMLYFKRKKRLMPFISFMAFLTGIFYSGPAISFLSLLLTGQNIDYLTYAYLSYTVMPINICIAMYIGFDIFKPELRNKVVIVYAITGIFYYIAWFGFPLSMIVPVDVNPGDLMDIRLTSVIMGLSALYILSVLLILGGGFYKLMKKLPIETLERKNARNLSIGWILFAIGAFLDTLISPELIVIARIIMAAGLIFIHLGFYTK